MVIESGSPKTEVASSNATPWVLRFVRAFVGSHSKMSPISNRTEEQGP